MRVKFTKMYDYTYPSGAMQNFPEGYEGSVRRIVGDAAVAAGAAQEVAALPGEADPDAPGHDAEVARAVTVHDVLPAA